MWSRSHNASIRVLPESNERINVVEYNQEWVLLCLVNVYLPTCGTADYEEAFGECMDMLHEIILKYNSSHAVIIGGDFNSSIHRGSSLRRDRLLMEFVSEHRLNVGVDCPVGDTFFHASNDSSSQIDYFLIAGSPSCSPSGKITIADQHYLNTSDHTHLELCLKMTSSSLLLSEAPTQDPSRGTKIRWEKCDTDLYKEIVQESLSLLHLFLRP